MKVFIYSSLSAAGVCFDPYEGKGYCWLTEADARAYEYSTAMNWPDCGHCIEALEVDRVYRPICLDDGGYDYVFATRKCFYDRRKAEKYLGTIMVSRAPFLLVVGD